jgi:hypothetical protein
LFLSLLGGDGLGEIPTFCILHDDFEFVLLGGVYFDELDDEGVIEIT